MRFFLVLFLAATAFAADDMLTSLALRGQTDFDRVRMAAFPNLPDTVACVQSEAALLAAALPAEYPLIHFRKGYCALLGATVTRSRSDYRDAAREFDKAGESATGVRVLASVAHLLAGDTDDPRVKAGLISAVRSEACQGRFLTADDCRAAVEAGRHWVGWLALRGGDLSEAALWLQPFAESGWSSWVAGLKAMGAHRPAEAAPALDKAVQLWSRDGKYPKPGLLPRLIPTPDLAEAYYQLSAARYLIGEYDAAIRNLETAIKLRPADARAIYLRGRSREMLGQPALADYELASRTAFANPHAPASSEAHYYRGVWLFGRKDFDRAEEQFASALNFGLGDSLRPDVLAWWRMAAVAGGACDASASYLQQALAAVSDFFPRPEAENLIRSCRAAAKLTPNGVPAAR